MRVLSFILYYLSYLIACYAAIAILLKQSASESGLFSGNKIAWFALAFSFVLGVISRILKPKIVRHEDGRTITQKR